MIDHKSALGDVQRVAETVGDKTVGNPLFEKLARFGHVAKGVVYIILGGLAAQAAFGLGGRTTNKQGALETMVTQPFGRIWLAFIAAGLLGYAAWRVVQAFWDPEQRGKDRKALGQRIGFGLSSFIYFGLALTAARLALGVREDSTQRLQELTARALGAPMGLWIVALTGLIVIGVGLFQMYKGWQANFTELLEWGRMSATEQCWMTSLGRFGLAARGVVQAIIGAFLLQAALRFDANEVHGSEGALEMLARPPFGWWVMGVVALGLVAYGAFIVGAARYSRIVKH